MGNESSMNTKSLQFEDSSSSSVNPFQFQSINGRLHLNGSEVHLNDIKQLMMLSNKTSQKVPVLSRTQANGEENLDMLWDEEMVARTVRNLAPFENTQATFSSQYNSHKIHSEGTHQSLPLPLQTKQRQFLQHTSKFGESIEEETMNTTKRSEQEIIQKVPFTRNSLSSRFVPSKKTITHRTEQSDSVLQFKCDDQFSTRNDCHFGFENYPNRQSAQRNQSRIEFKYENKNEINNLELKGIANAEKIEIVSDAIIEKKEYAQKIETTNNNQNYDDKGDESYMQNNEDSGLLSSRELNERQVAILRSLMQEDGTFLRTLQKTLQIQQQQSKDLEAISVSNPILKDDKLIINDIGNTFLENNQTGQQYLKKSISASEQDSPPMLVRNNIQREKVDCHFRSLSADQDQIFHDISSQNGQSVLMDLQEGSEDTYVNLQLTETVEHKVSYQGEEKEMNFMAPIRVDEESVLIEESLLEDLRNRNQETDAILKNKPNIQGQNFQKSNIESPLKEKESINRPKSMNLCRLDLSQEKIIRGLKKTTEESISKERKSHYLSSVSQEKFKQKISLFEEEDSHLDEYQSCLTENSRNDRKCLEEMNQQINYLKRRSSHMDSTIGQEISYLENQVQEIFSKIRQDKIVLSKEIPSNQHFQSVKTVPYYAHASLAKPYANSTATGSTTTAATTSHNSSSSLPMNSNHRQFNSRQQQYPEDEGSPLHQLQQNQNYSTFRDNKEQEFDRILEQKTDRDSIFSEFSKDHIRISFKGLEEQKNELQQQSGSDTRKREIQNNLFSQESKQPIDLMDNCSSIKETNESYFHKSFSKDSPETYHDKQKLSERDIRRIVCTDGEEVEDLEGPFQEYLEKQSFGSQFFQKNKKLISSKNNGYFIQGQQQHQQNSINFENIKISKRKYDSCRQESEQSNSNSFSQISNNNSSLNMQPSQTIQSYSPNCSIIKEIPNPHKIDNLNMDYGHINKSTNTMRSSSVESQYFNTLINFPLNFIEKSNNKQTKLTNLSSKMTQKQQIKPSQNENLVPERRVSLVDLIQQSSNNQSKQFNTKTIFNTDFDKSIYEDEFQTEESGYKNGKKTIKKSAVLIEDTNEKRKILKNNGNRKLENKRNSEQDDLMYLRMSEIDDTDSSCFLGNSWIKLPTKCNSKNDIQRNLSCCLYAKENNSHSKLEYQGKRKESSCKISLKQEEIAQFLYPGKSSFIGKNIIQNQSQKQSKEDKYLDYNYPIKQQRAIRCSSRTSSQQRSVLKSKDKEYSLKLEPQNPKKIAADSRNRSSNSQHVSSSLQQKIKSKMENGTEYQENNDLSSQQSQIVQSLGDQNRVYRPLLDNIKKGTCNAPLQEQLQNRIWSSSNRSMNLE